MEVPMSDRLFDSPIFVKDGKFLIREIAGPIDAIDFLYEWPQDDRDVVYEVAWSACCDAHSGQKPLIVAQNAFEGFARKRKILEKPEAAMPWMTSHGNGGGRVQV
jgi:hypothetical protein